MIKKILFWTFTILLGFVNPLISFGLIVLYYLPGIIEDLCRPCNQNESTTVSEVIVEEEKARYKMEQTPDKMNSFSEDVLEDMK